MENFTIDRTIYGQFEMMETITIPRCREAATATPPQVNEKVLLLNSRQSD